MLLSAIRATLLCGALATLVACDSATSSSDVTRTRACSTGRSISSMATMKVTTAMIRPLRKPPSEKASSSWAGEEGEESWSSIARWNFC